MGRSFGKGRKSLGLGVASSNLLLNTLLVLLVHGSESRKMSEKYGINLDLPSSNDEIKDGMSQIDPSLMIFFALEGHENGAKNAHLLSQNRPFKFSSLVGQR